MNDDLIKRARAKAQNDEMIDQHYTETGRLLMDCAEALEHADGLLAAAVGRIRYFKDKIARNQGRET